MKRCLFLLGFLLCLGGRAWALGGCTYHATVTSASTALANTFTDRVTGQAKSRHYLFVQNTGTANPMNIAVASGNNAQAGDTYLAPGAAFVLGPSEQGIVPGGDVAAISASGTTAAFCEY